MSPFRSVGARLSVALLLVVAGALGLVYAIVVPSMESRLVDAKLSQLERAAPTLAFRLPAAPIRFDFIENAAASTGARVLVYDMLAEDSLTITEDSLQGASAEAYENDPIVLRAARTLRAESGTVTRGGERFAEVAAPVPVLRPQFLLLSASLRDSLNEVKLVKRRLLVAGLLALLAAVAVGYGASWMFARRIRRLERAAERIAGGRFDEPVVDPGSDELGELARAFERMRQRLAQLEDARREFIANASHELRTPLFSLGGFLELFADEELDDATRREFLTTMRQQVDRLTKLATDLLDLSRLDAGRLHVEREMLALEAVARSLMDEFGAVAQASDHPLELTGEDVAAVGDEQRVLQIGRILVENALLHTPPGTRVTVRALAEEGNAVLAVEDEGPGIPADQVPQLFQRFYRIDGNRASGSGLGLAIARELAELMGGSIELDSRPGRTVFALVLPAAVGVGVPEGDVAASFREKRTAAR